MKVLIVAKTRQGSGACIGGITFEGQSVRLIAADAATNERAGLEYQVGEVWEVVATPAEHVIPPHVENIIVPIEAAVRHDARLHPVHRAAHASGGRRPELLFDGPDPSGSLRRPLHRRAQRHSTLQHHLLAARSAVDARVEDGKRIRYRYPTPDGGRTLVFVGFQEPSRSIPAGTLLRVSLAHWWRRRRRYRHRAALLCPVVGLVPAEDGLFSPGADGLRAKQSPPSRTRCRIWLCGHRVHLPSLTSRAIPG